MPIMMITLLNGVVDRKVFQEPVQTLNKALALGLIAEDMGVGDDELDLEQWDFESSPDKKTATAICENDTYVFAVLDN